MPNDKDWRQLTIWRRILLLPLVPFAFLSTLVFVLVFLVPLAMFQACAWSIVWLRWKLLGVPLPPPIPLVLDLPEHVLPDLPAMLSCADVTATAETLSGRNIERGVLMVITRLSQEGVAVKVTVQRVMPQYGSRLIAVVDWPTAPRHARHTRLPFFNHTVALLRQNGAVDHTAASAP